MLTWPKPDSAFLDLPLSAGQLVGLLENGDTVAGKMMAERIPIAAAYILKHYNHSHRPLAEIRKNLQMRSLLFTKAEHWSRHLPPEDLSCLETLLWSKGYKLGQPAPLRSQSGFGGASRAEAGQGARGQGQSDAGMDPLLSVWGRALAGQRLNGDDHDPPAQLSLPGMTLEG